MARTQPTCVCKCPTEKTHGSLALAIAIPVLSNILLVVVLESWRRLRGSGSGAGV
jgi:hypothetical protein